MSKPTNVFEIHWQSRYNDKPTTVYADSYYISGSDLAIIFSREIEGKPRSVHAARWDCVLHIKLVRSNVDDSSLDEPQTPAPSVDHPVDAEDETRVVAAAQA